MIRAHIGIWKEKMSAFFLQRPFFFILVVTWWCSICLSWQIGLCDKVLLMKESFGCCSLEDLMKMEAVTKLFIQENKSEPFMKNK